MEGVPFACEAGQPSELEFGFFAELSAGREVWCTAWCTFWEWGLGGKARLSCRPWKKDVSGGQGSQNSAIFSACSRALKLQHCFKYLLLLFFQQEEQVPRGFFSVLKAADSTTGLGNRTVSEIVLFYSKRGSWKQRFAVLGDFHASPPVWSKRFHPK